MRVNHEGRQYHIAFYHKHFAPNAQGAGKKFRAYTYCLISELELKADGTANGGHLVAQDRARCAREDQFFKETGRQISLHRAVNDLPRELRGKLLSAYYRRRQS